VAAAVTACARLRLGAPAHATDPLFTQRSRTAGAGVWDTQLMRERIGGSQEGRARHLGTAPMDCSCDALLYGDTGL
jgi:hypothetical protein